MSQNKNATDAPGEISGQMFLYEKPELLTPEIHGEMGFTPAERPFDYVKNVRAVPLTMVEFSSAQRNYPVIFSDIENPVPLAVFAVLDEDNLFVTDEGTWDPMAYVPAYLQCHPFTLATEEGGRMAVVVDAAAASVSRQPQYPFFVDGKISEHADKLMRLVTHYEQEREKTRQFCAKLVELELLTSLRAAHTPEGATEPEPIADYVGIDVQKLDSLPADTIHEMHKAGFLSAAYMQIYSLENWRHLVARKVARRQAA